MQRNPAIALAPSLGQLAVKPRDHLIELQLNPGDLDPRNGQTSLQKRRLGALQVATVNGEITKRCYDTSLAMRGTFGVLRTRVRSYEEILSEIKRVGVRGSHLPSKRLGL